MSLALDYATLILHDAKLTIDAANINSLVKAAGVTVPSYMVDLYVNVLNQKKVDSILAVSAASAPAAAAPVAAAAAAPAKKAVVEEKKEESDDDMGMGLFD